MTTPPDPGDPRTVLVTGFGPFAKHRVNPSWQAVATMAARGGLAGVALVTEELPVGTRGPPRG